MNQPTQARVRELLDYGGAVHRVLALLAACNLTVVPQSYRHVDHDEYRALQILASKRLREDV